MTDYEEYRDDLREWLLWSFCASIDDVKYSYKGDDDVEFYFNIDDTITPERCHTLNFMLDYLAGTDAPAIDDHDASDSDIVSDNYEQANLKLEYILRLDAKKQALVDKLDGELGLEEYSDCDLVLATAGSTAAMWDEYIAFRDDFE